MKVGGFVLDVCFGLSVCVLGVEKLVVYLKFFFWVSVCFFFGGIFC